MVINMTHELYIKLIKEDMENATKTQLFHTGQVTKEQLVEIALEKLATIDNPEINKIINMYREQKEEYIKQANEVNEKIYKLIEQVYDSIIKDL